MERMRLTMCLKKLNEAHEQLTNATHQEFTVSDLRLLDSVKQSIDTCLEVMASNRAIEKALGRGNR
jgi:hypothetical protein